MVVERSNEVGRRHLAEVMGELVLIRGSGGEAARATPGRPSSSRCAVPVFTREHNTLAMISPLAISD